MKYAAVTIEGLSPLLMHRFPMEPIEAMEKKTPEEQARIALYELDGKPYIPGVALHRTLINGAAYSKGKGRASLQKVVCAALFVEESILPLNGKTVPWAVDSRPVVVPATRGRILRHRPRFDQWETNFTLAWDETLMTEQQVRRIVDDAGQRVGILDFRPATKGPMGRFVVTKWKGR